MRTLSACALIGLVALPSVADGQTRLPLWLATAGLAASDGQAPGGVQAPAPQAPVPQAPAPQAAPALPVEYRIGFLDFGARGSSVEGDRARYERYRDLGNGLFLEVLRWHVQPSGWFVDIAADHMGRKDQRYAADFVRPGKLDAWVLWDQIPMWMSAKTQTLFTEESPSILRISEDIQRQVQASSSALPAYIDSAPTFDLESRRHIGQGGVRYKASPDLTLHATVQSTNREGELVVGGSFGHSVLVEMPAPIRHTTTDVDAGAEFENGRLLVRGGYTGSFFHNDVTSLEFDNPFRALPDISGTSSHGRLALAPSNSFVSVNGLASVALARRTRVTASFAIGSLQSASETSILPHTVNAALPVVPVARASVDGEADTASVNLRLTSRPASGIDFNVQYRMYDYDNRTPELVITQRVAYDNSRIDPDRPEAHGTVRGPSAHVRRRHAPHAGRRDDGGHRLQPSPRGAHAPHLRIDQRGRAAGDLRRAKSPVVFAPDEVRVRPEAG